MTASSPARRRDRALGSDLVASDGHYFEAGAHRYSAGAARISHLPGFEALASGCVVHGVRPGWIRGDVSAWVESVEERIRALGGAFSRWYLDESDATAALAEVLAQSGYRRRVELGFVRDAPQGADRAPESGNDPRANGRAVALRAIDSPHRWAAKLAIHRQSSHGVDGYAVSPEDWLAMERRKCEAGYMRPYLIEVDGEPAGAVNVASSGRILRMKNLVVAPEFQRQRVATRVAVGLARLAAVAGREAVGCFALLGEIGERVYPGAGYRLVVRQVEWVKPLASASPVGAPREVAPRLTAARIADYHRDGFAVVRGFLSGSEVARLRDECERIWSGLPVGKQNPRVQWREHVDGGRVADRLDPVIDLSAVLTALAEDPRILRAAGDLLAEDAVFFKDKLIMKRPGTLGYGLHQDYPYWEHLGAPADAYVTCFFALDSFDGPSGSTEMFPGLHRRRLPAPPEDPLDCDERAIDLTKGHALALDPGDVVFMHSLTPHRSPPNRSPQSRRVLIFTYTKARHAGIRAIYDRGRQRHS
jgi:ectoine hydroxylase-related dioxygenase (phytanoyl-CoA dioxygenase family)